MLRPFLRSCLVLSAMLSCVAAAQAHDTWFQALAPAGAAPLLALGTGTRFPVYESGIGAEYLERQGCSRDAGAGQPAAQPFMQPLRNDPHALVLRGVARASSCWAQLVPLEIELPADKVAIYLREVQADATLRAAWADMQRRGVPWKEHYTKHARIDFAAGNGEAVPMDMDIVREASADPGLHFRVLRDGRPLPGLAVEWISDSASLGIWRRTDSEGRVRVPPLPAGRWVLRATDLRLSATAADRWESRFVTLAFVVPAASATASAARDGNTARAAAAVTPPRR